MQARDGADLPVFLSSPRPGKAARTCPRFNPSSGNKDQVIRQSGDQAIRLNMDIKINSMIWGLEIRLNETLVMLAYADYADQQGGGISPAVRAIAAKTGLCPSTVRAITRRLVRRGCLVPDGRAPGGTRRFFIPLPAQAISACTGHDGGSIHPAVASIAKNGNI